MSDVFIPLGGAGGKNRGTAAVLGDSTPFSNAGAVMSLPLPAGNYKKSVSNPRSSYGDGKNSELSISKGLLKQMALNAFGIASITNFSLALYAHKQVRLTWARPSQGLWSGVHFVFKYDSVPTSVTDGFMQVDSADVYYTTTALQERTLYVRAYNYVTTNEGRWYDSGNVSSTIRVSGVSGSVTFGAGAGTWTVPANVYKIRYILVGQGGEGATSSGNYVAGGGGGGYFSTGYMDVTPGQQIPWIVPSVDNNTNRNHNTPYYSGGNLPEKDTVFGGIRAQHGRYPIGGTFNGRDWRHNCSGGNGGSGGAAFGGSPGTNGASGSGASSSVTYRRRQNRETYYLSGVVPGQGQGTSTIGFNGVLYSSGGVAGTTDTISRGVDATNGLGGGGGGGNSYGHGSSTVGGNPGTGCIYIAWGSSMNDGS